MADVMVLVGNIGADGRKVLEVGAVSLTTKGMDLLRTPGQMLGRVGLVRTVLLLLLQCLRCW
jgi:hypothetical protein